MTPEQPDETPPVQSSKMWIYIIVGIILLLIVFAVIYFFKNKNKNKTVELQKIEEEKRKGDDVTKKLDTMINYQNEVLKKIEILSIETNKKFEHITSRIDNIKVPREDKSRLKDIEE